MRIHPVLLVVFLLVLQRWIETVTGWPEWVAFPAVGLAGTALIDWLMLPPTARLGSRAWVTNVGLAAGVAVLLRLLST